MAALIAWFGLFRAARVRLIASTEGVRIVNPLRRTTLSWGQVRRFSLRPWKWSFTPIGVADLKDGSSVPILGIAAPNPFFRPRNRVAADMVDELNRMLAAADEGLDPMDLDAAT
jgi:hypothetical protein